jgi:proteic killer suppression protein
VIWRFRRQTSSKSLEGDLKGLYSIRINKQWRICLRWDAGDAFEVLIVDYH